MKTAINIGDRIYNHGDMANASHFGTITDIKINHKFGNSFCVTPDTNETDLDNYWIEASAISATYKGHGGTRIVFESEYKRHQEAMIKKYLNN